MTDQLKVTRAALWELDAKGVPLPQQPGVNPVKVQFNPETLKVTFSNQVVPPTNATQTNSGKPATNQAETAGAQIVGRGSTKMTVTLWFDITANLPDDVATPDERSDVRKLTQKVAHFIKPKAGAKAGEYIPPGIRFSWGSFLFDGIMESLEESLEFFSPEGVPLRASLSISISQQTFQFAINNSVSFHPPAANGAPGGAPAGTAPLAQAPGGANLQSMAAASGIGTSWQAVASANGIENPRLLQPGMLINLNASAPEVNLSAPSVTVSAPTIQIRSR